MQINLMLTVKCDECKTEYVPDHITFNPSIGDRDNPGLQIAWVRFVPHCPACNAIANVLRRANLHGLVSKV